MHPGHPGTRLLCFVYAQQRHRKTPKDHGSVHQLHENLINPRLTNIRASSSLATMSSREEVTLPATRPKSRKSLGHIPSTSEMDQENATADLGALVSGKKSMPIEKPSKKSRSKSI